MSTTTRPRARRSPHEYRGPARSCEQCFTWGVLRGRLCRGCENFATKNPSGRCRTCHRDVPVHSDICRLCRKQASLIAGPDNKGVVDVSVAATTGQQLFFADMERAVSLQQQRHRRSSGTPIASPHRAPTVVPDTVVIAARAQAPLFDLPRDCRKASSLDPARDQKLLDLALGHADRLSEHHGWPARTLQQVQRGLRMLASCHDPGEPIKASTVDALSPVGVPALRVLEVLTACEGDLLIQDRPDSLSLWIAEQFRVLPPQMRQELDTWIVVLREGTPRRRALHRSTVASRLAGIQPFLLECASKYRSLRQVTRDDILTWLDGRKHRATDASALRNLFRTLKTQRLVFADPTSRIRVSAAHSSTPTSLSPDTLRHVAEAASHDPSLRVVLALIGVHALHPHQVRNLGLDHVDLPNQRLRTGGIDRVLDSFTTLAVADYLRYRHGRWPSSSNQHLLMTRRTAHERGPVSEYWLSGLLRGLPLTLRQLREDRILEEAHATGGDPLHLAGMFGIGARTGRRYADVTHPGLADPR